MKITSRSLSDSSFYDAKIITNNSGGGTDKYMVYRLMEKKNDLNVDYEITVSFDNAAEENYTHYSESCKIGNFAVKGSIIDFDLLTWSVLSQYINQSKKFSFIVDGSNTMFVVVRYYSAGSGSGVTIDGQNLKLVSSNALSQKLLIDETIYIGNLTVNREKISKEKQLATSDKTVTLSPDDNKVKQILNLGPYDTLMEYAIKHLPGTTSYDNTEELSWNELQQELFDTFKLASGVSRLGSLFKIEITVRWQSLSLNGSRTYYLDHESASSINQYYIKDLQQSTSTSASVWPTSKWGDSLEDCFNKIYITFSNNGLINGLEIADYNEDDWKGKITRILGVEGKFYIEFTHKFEPYFGSTIAEGDQIEFKAENGVTETINYNQEAVIDYKGTKLNVSFKNGSINMSSYYGGYFYPLEQFYSFTLISDAIPFYIIDTPTQFNYPILSSCTIKEEDEYINYNVVALYGSTIKVYPKNTNRDIGAQIIAILP